MHNDNNLPAAQARDGLDQVNSLDEFRDRAEKGSGIIESWVECTVVHRNRVAGEDELILIGKSGPQAQLELRAVLPETILWRLQERHGAQPDWISALLGSRLKLRLRARPGDKTTICDLWPKWVDETIRAEHRAYRRELAELGVFELQHQLAEPDDIERICVIADDHDPAWRAIEDRLAALGVPYFLEQAVFEGNPGRLSVIGALRRAAERAEAGNVDAVLMIYGGADGPGAYVLHNDDAATSICSMPVPFVLGLKRPRQGSLLHDVSYAAADEPAGAIDIVEDLVWRAKEAVIKQLYTERSEQRWREERAEQG